MSDAVVTDAGATSAQSTVESTQPTQTTQESTSTSTVKYEKFGQLLDLVPEEIRSAKTWDKFKDADLATGFKAIVDMDKWIGKKGDIPQETATEKDRSDFADKLGFVPSKDPTKFVELDANVFGESKGDLEAMYNNAGEAVFNKAIENFRKNPSPEAIKDAIRDYIKNDVENTITSQKEMRIKEEQRINEIAGKLGTTPSALLQTKEAIMNRMGWSQDTHVLEVFAEMEKNISNSKVSQNTTPSTPIGKQTRMSQIINDPLFWKGDAKLVAEHQRLFDELNKG